MPTVPKAANVLLRPPPRFFTAWSYSRWADHSSPETGCPRRARLKHLDKLPEGDKGTAMQRGADIHKDAEDFVKGTVLKGKKITKLPPTLGNFKEEFAMLRKRKASAEGKWGFDVKWQPVDFFDWDRCWVRIITDAHYQVSPIRVVNVDYKTGKVYGTNEDQLELAAVGTFSVYPKATEVLSQLWYLDQGIILPKTEAEQLFHRRNLAKLQKKWRERSIPLLMDRKFVPRPGPHCSRCPWSKAKGGPCEFGG